MASYTTNLKTWGATGQEFPDNYSYLEDEAPVDAWDNFLTHNLISDVKDHLIPLTNSRIETDYGTTRPSSPEDGHLFYDSGAPTLEQYRASDSSWHALALDEDLSAHEADTGNPHSVTLEQARTAGATLSGSVDFGGNNLNGLSVAEFQSADVRVSHAARELLVEEHDGTSWTTRLSVDETGASVTGALSVSNTLSVTGTSTFNADADFTGSLVGGIGTAKFSDAAGDTNQWTLTEDGTSGNLEARHAGTAVLDVGSSIVDVLAALRENGDRVATRPWIQDGFSMSGLLEVNADIRVGTGQSLEDGGGTNRLAFNSGYTSLKTEAGNDALNANETAIDLVADSSTPVRIYDGEGGFHAVQYTTSASAPGTLELTNADIDLSGNQIRNTRLVRASDSTQLDIQSGIGADIQVRDRANSQPIAWFKEGGGVEIPNGYLSIQNSRLQPFDGGDSLAIRGNHSTNDIEIQVRDAAQEIKFVDKVNSQPVLVGYTGGNVSVPSGTLSVKGNTAVVSSSGEYDIQKNGSDASGVINFKT